MDSTIKKLNKNDYVVVLAGKNIRNLVAQDLTQIANKCFFTNLTQCTIAFNPVMYSRFNNINHVNRTTSNVISKLEHFNCNVKLLNFSETFLPDDFLNTSIYTNDKGLKKLSLLVGYIVKIFPNSQSTNLHVINTTLLNSVPESQHFLLVTKSITIK